MCPVLENIYWICSLGLVLAVHFWLWFAKCFFFIYFYFFCPLVLSIYLCVEKLIWFRSWNVLSGFGSLGPLMMIQLWLYSVFILNFHLYISIWIFYSVSVLEKYIRELVPFCGVFFADWNQNVYRKMV